MATALLLHGHAYAFLLSRDRLLAADASADEATHYSYSGWKARVDPTQEQEFLQRVAEDLAGGNLNFIIEKKTPRFKMHLDLDWLEESEVSPARIRQLVGVLNEGFARFFPESDGAARDPLFHTVIMTTTCQTGKVGTDGETPCVKSGFHLIWPNLHVTKEHALMLRAYSLSMILERFGPRDPPCNTWDDVVDETVLRKNGLRMIGSYKRSKCPNCKGRGRLCELCRETGGMIIPNRRYMPVEVLCGDGQLEPRKTERLNAELQRRNFAYAVQLCTIRTHDPETPGFVVPEDAVHVAPLDDEARHRQMRTGKRNRRYRAILSRDDERRSRAVARNKRASVDRDSVLYGLFCAEVKRYSSRYENLLVNKIVYDPDAKADGRPLTYILDVRGRGQHWCANIKKAHSSNRIYFSVSEKGMVQRCHKCRKFHGRIQRLSLELSDQLFAPETIREKRKQVERELRSSTQTSRDKSKARDKLSMLLYEETEEMIKDLRPKYEGKRGMRLDDLRSDRAHSILGVSSQRVAQMGMAEMLALERTCYAEKTSRRYGDDDAAADQEPRHKKKKQRRGSRSSNRGRRIS